MYRVERYFFEEKLLCEEGRTLKFIFFPNQIARTVMGRGEGISLNAIRNKIFIRSTDWAFKNFFCNSVTGFPKSSS